jgi:hypothetical protein
MGSSSSQARVLDGSTPMEDPFRQPPERTVVQQTAAAELNAARRRTGRRGLLAPSWPRPEAMPQHSSAAARGTQRGPQQRAGTQRGSQAEADR